MSVVPGSLADRAKIQAGQKLVEMNGRPVMDALDYQFQLHDETIQMTVEVESGGTRTLTFEKEYDQALGLELPGISPRTCRNKCIFCFVDQLPRGLRKSLYVKDEDYRLSFLQGNYVTLSDLREEELDRIVRQRLSPLYVSVHCTDESVRRSLLGRRNPLRIAEAISRLTRGSIQLHCQLVICPSINDGKIMERSVSDLAGFFPGVQSVALVPVGLTGHRQGLTVIPPVGRAEALKLIKMTDRWQRLFRRSLGRGFVYLADELFLLAGQDIPPADDYDGFPQLENGVGMVRSFLDLFDERQRAFPGRIEKQKRISLITGHEAEPFMRRVADRLSQIENLTAELIVVDNQFFGGGVTVSGLLTGADILATLRRHPSRGTVILPPNCLNADRLFLDGVTVDDLEHNLERTVRNTPVGDPLSTIEEVLS